MWKGVVRGICWGVAAVFVAILAYTPYRKRHWLPIGGVFLAAMVAAAGIYLAGRLLV